jgi:assimilatory nitrate reductase catalytic subunit
MPETRSTCPYCGVGCGVLIRHDGQQVLDVRGDPDHPANRGRLCTKGSTLALTARQAIAQGTRLLHPQVRAQRPGPWQPLGWTAALDLAAQRIADTVRQHGADAVAVYGSGQWLTEDYHAFNKLVKGVLGTHQLDTNSRLCMSSAVAGYKATLGADAPPACYDDLDHAHTLFISGSNTAWAHPILFRRIEDAKAARPGLRLIVADPRRTETAASADLHLPLQPGTDVTLCHGLLHIMLWEGWVDSAYIAAHTTGFDDLKALVRDFTPAHVARVCGLPEADLHTAARWIAGLDTAPTHATATPTTGTFTGLDGRARRPTLSLYCQGLNQSSHGTANNAALIHLHLATGQIGQVGAGPFSLTGQPNAMGGREVGGMANLLPGHRDLANPAHRAEVEALWGLNTLGRQLAAQPGRTAVEMFQAAADGQVKLLWIACTNPAQSLPDQATVRRALERAEFVIVQEAFAHTATTAHAHLLLPATTWAEKEGTVTNSERRISRVRAAVPPPVHPDHPHEGPRHDWRIARDVGQRLEALLHPAAPSTSTPTARLMAWDGPEALWNEHREATRGRDLDITGLSYATLEQHGPQQWPCPEGATQGQPRLYTEGRFPTPDGKARFAVALMNTSPVAEARSAPYPFALTTGRLRDQWHGMSRTGLLGRLFGHVPEPVVLMHPQDMARRRLHTGQLVRVSSRRGSVVVPVQDSTDQGLGQLFMAMHWGPECLSGRDALGQPLQGVNALTNPAFCPTSKQPELKHTAVSVVPAELPWTLLALAWLPETQAPTARQALVQRMAAFDFAVCVPFGRETDGRTGLLFRAACASPPPAALLDELCTLLGLNTPNTLRYDDARRHQRRAIRLWRDTATATATDTPRLDAFLLAGDTQAEGWIKTLLQDELPVQGPAHRLLLASSQAPQPLAASSPQVCTCHNVSEAAIATQLRTCPGSASERLAALQATLKCGTQCGSCLPTVKRLVASVPAEGQLMTQSHIS